MRWTNIHRGYFVLHLFLAIAAVNGQQTDQFPSVEKWQVFTDRTLYVAGETIHFSAFLIDVEQPQLSRILYAEIISPDIRQVKGGKFPVINKSAGGSLMIPEDIITGFYYLRVYTKYMRNAGPATYTYLGLWIVNPSRIEVMQANDTLWPSVDQNRDADSIIFSIKPDKNLYKPRDVVHVSIAPVHFPIDDIQGASISVVPKLSSLNYPITKPKANKTDFNFKFYPEIRGLSISGAVKNRATGKMIAGTMVNFSIIGEGRDFMSIQTDSSGRYVFPLPAYSDFRDVFLCAEDAIGYKSKILVDNDFCTMPYQLPSPIFKLTEDERKLLYQMAVNKQIGDAFGTGAMIKEEEYLRSNRPFYGTPTSVISFDSYVELPTLEEYFNELPTQVKVRKNEGKKYFKVLGTQSEMLFYDPLVLVDWVAVDNPSKILVLSPKSISRIEVVNEPYIKGNITYGGIVSIISKQGDFAGIDLPESGVFIHYKFLDDKIINVENQSASQNLPDTRNTLYWEPNLDMKKSKPTQISFSAPDTPCQYQIILKVINSDGEIIVHKSIFEVVDDN